MMGDVDRVRENRLRRMAARQGLRLVKSPRRDRYADGYGTYRLESALDGDHRAGDAAGGYGMDLDAVEQHLTSRPATVSAPPSGAGRSLPASETGADARSQLTVTVVHVDGHAEVVLIGELDFASVPQLRREMEPLIEQRSEGRGVRQDRRTRAGPGREKHKQRVGAMWDAAPPQRAGHRD